MNSRFAQVQKIHNGDKDVIQDRTMYEDAFIFAPNLHAMGLMSTRDFENYKNLVTSFYIGIVIGINTTCYPMFYG